MTPSFNSMLISWEQVPCVLYFMEDTSLSKRFLKEYIKMYFSRYHSILQGLREENVPLHYVEYDRSVF